MKVQRVRIPNSNHVTWVVLGDNYLPIQPIREYLRYLENIERSPNTVLAYANHLKLYWEFLQDSHLDWCSVALENFADFIHWLRRPKPTVVSIQPVESKRTERTINTILTAVRSFYNFQYRMGNVEELKFSGQLQFGSSPYKSLLYGIAKSKPVQISLIKLKETKTQPGALTAEQIKQLISACMRLRNKFLICLLYETGMRIGQALGLRHQDIRSWDNEIQITPRSDNTNGARAKSRKPYVIHVSQELMALYSDYLINEYPEDVDSDYVFLNIWEGQVGLPITYSTVNELFRQLERKTGIKATPHLFRHTHATELIRTGWNVAHVQKRLGHASVQTTINTYAHLTDDDLKRAYHQYLEQRSKQEEVDHDA